MGGRTINVHRLYLQRGVGPIRRRSGEEDGLDLLELVRITGDEDLGTILRIRIRSSCPRGRGFGEGKAGHLVFEPLTS